MIKECKVISYNKFLNILVFEYEEKQIQTTVFLDEKSKTVFVECKNGQYKIIDKNEYDNQDNKKKEKRISKIDNTMSLDIKNED